MLKLIPREKLFMKGYKKYCQEFYDKHIVTFVPTNPPKIDENWFERTAEWYARKERESFDGNQRGFHIGLLRAIDLLESFNCVSI